MSLARAAFFAAMHSVRDITLSGSLDATAAAGVATSTTRTVSVPAGNSGQITFSTFIDVGTISNIQYSKNAGAFTTFVENDVITFADGDTLAIRTNGNGAGESRTFTLTDQTTGRTIGTYVHTGA